jgi:methionine-rich copper-binding protein CopC
MRARHAVLAAAALLAAASPALAHALLEHAAPAVGAVVADSPTQLRLEFSEGVTPALSQVTLSNAKGAPIALGPLATAPGAKQILLAPLRAPLPTGVYRVGWRVVSADTHVTQGNFVFTVNPALKTNLRGP